MRVIQSVIAILALLACQLALAQQRDVYVVVQGAPQQTIEGAPVQGVGPPGGYTFAAQSLLHGVATSQTTTGPTNQAARTVMADLVLTKAMGVASQYLTQMMLQNHPLPSVAIDFVAQGPRGPVVESQMVLQNVSVKGVQRTVNRDSRLPVDTITLGFGSVTWTFYAVGPNGQPVVRHTMTYDLARGVSN